MFLLNSHKCQGRTNCLIQYLSLFLLNFHLISASFSCIWTCQPFCLFYLSLAPSLSQLVSNWSQLCCQDDKFWYYRGWWVLSLHSPQGIASTCASTDFVACLWRVLLSLRGSMFSSESCFVLADCSKRLRERRQPVSLGRCPGFTRTDAHSQPQSTADRWVNKSASWCNSAS